VLDEHFERLWQINRATPIDRFHRRRHGQPVHRLVRCAEDVVVLVSGTREHWSSLRPPASGTP